MSSSASSSLRTFPNRIYLIDTKFTCTESDAIKAYPNKSLEDYAAETAYRIVGELMSENRSEPKRWTVDILRDNTRESLQLAYQIMAYIPQKGMLAIISSMPHDIKAWYNQDALTGNTLAILADASTLNIMGYRLLDWYRVYPSDEILVDEYHNCRFDINSKSTRKIPKFSRDKEHKDKYIEQQSKLNIENDFDVKLKIVK